MKAKWKISPYLYIFPALFLLMAFRLIPIVMSFIISFFDWSIKGTGKFIGLMNYATMLKDEVFWDLWEILFWLLLLFLQVLYYLCFLLFF